MSELKLCPFCGCEAKISLIQIAEDETASFVSCTECFAKTDGYEAPFGEPEAAAGEWNNRPIEDALVEALNVWDVGEAESLYSLLTNRVSRHTESGNIIIEDGAYTMLLRVIEKQRLTALIQAGVEDE